MMDQHGAPAVEGYPVDNRGARVDLTMAYVKKCRQMGVRFETSRAGIKLQQEGRLPWIPIVALTAHAVPDKIHACHDAGMVAHLAKPINKARLLATLKQVLRDPGKGSR